MIVEDQSAVVAFLSRPSTHGENGPVEVMETHISLVFLVGGRAFKLKRAVKLPYVDFSSAWLRLAACQKEVELNSPTAPGLYLGAREIRRDAEGRLSFDGDGELVDAVVEMVRFEQDCLFDSMAADGRLTARQMEEVAHMIALFHRDAPAVPAESGSANMAGVLDVNEAGFATSQVFASAETGVFNRAFRQALDRAAPLLDRRAGEGRIRRCHGDLHLRNICLFRGRPRLFDCIEFNDRIATVDVLYDFAFLLMDLWHRDLPGFANLAMNRYLDETGDEDGFVLLPFFMAVRAAVRAHVLATQAAETAGGGARLAEAARSYFELARALLEPAPGGLVAIGGLSGSGKTTVAEALAPSVGVPPGARIVESDRVRKGLFGVSAETRLPGAAYAPEVSARVYRTVTERAEAILRAGGSVVVDAVFDRPGNRALVEAAARAAGAPFRGIWLEAEASQLRDRVLGRVGGPSDATAAVLEQQLARDVGEMSWTRVDSARPLAEVVGTISGIVGNPRTAR